MSRLMNAGSGRLLIREGSRRAQIGMASTVQLRLVGVEQLCERN
jgi:hypothetical protein